MKIAIRTVFSLLVVGTLAFAGCNKYDDSALTGRVDDLENRVTELEKLVADLQTNVNSVSKAVKALEDGDRIVSVTPFNDNTGSGFIVEFSKSGPMKVFNGEKPVVSVEKGEDGVYYWTVDGEPMMDGEDKIPATIAPEFKVEGGKFWFRVNNGEWMPVAGSDSGVGLIKDIVSDEENVTFILSEGGEIVIPKVQAFRLNIDVSEAGIFANSSVSVPYTVTSGDAETKVAAIAGSGYQATVNGDSQSGTITITAPATVPAQASVIVMAVNGKGVQSSKILTFEQGELKIAKDTYTIGAQGGELVLELETNVEFLPLIDPDPKNAWLKIVDNPATKALRKETVTVSAEPYVGGTESRTAEVNVMYGNGEKKTFIVTQLHTEIISGGSADLSTFTSSIGGKVYETDQSVSGWTFKNCLMYGPSNWDKIAEKTVVLSGGTDKVGVLTSPVLEGGCGVLTIRYGTNLSSANNKMKFKVDVKNESGTVLKTETVGEEDGSFVQRQVYEKPIEVNASGKFTVELTNLCPSGATAPPRGANDAVILLSVEWTGYTE